MSAAPEPLPHGFPVRLVERAERRDGDRFALVLATADGALTGARPWPASLLAEALAQAILLVARPRGASALRLVALNRVTVHRPVEAGDRLEVEIAEAAAYGGLRRFTCRGRLGATLAVEAEITVSGS